MTLRWRSWLLVGLGMAALLLAIPLLLVAGGDVQGLAARRLSVALILGGGLLAPFLGQRPNRGRLCWEGGLLLLQGGVLLMLGRAWGLSWGQALAGSAVVFLSWGGCWAVALFLRALGGLLLAPLLFLAVQASLCWSPYFLAPQAGTVPDWLLLWNPLVRLQWQLAGQDWLRGPLLYSQAGDRFFRYPTGAQGVLPFLAGSALVLLLAFLILGVGGRARASSGQPVPSVSLPERSPRK